LYIVSAFIKTHHISTCKGLYLLKTDREMKTNLRELSSLAADLMKKKNQIPSDEYQLQMEAIIDHLAKSSVPEKIKTPSAEVDLVEKMSFEIRTPMNSILGFTGLLKDSYFTREEKNEFIDLIEKNTQHLVQLLNDLTDLTKIENFQMDLRIEEFEINVFMLNLIADFQKLAKEKNILLDKLPSKTTLDNICISSDPYQLRHIIENLILSLVNFSENNKVHLSIEIENSSILIINILSEKAELPETISSSIKKHISYTNKENSFDGTGLRLTLTKALVDLMGGLIEFNCVPNKGSEFVLEIPIKVCLKR